VENSLIVTVRRRWIHVVLSAIKFIEDSVLVNFKSGNLLDLTARKSLAAGLTGNDKLAWKVRSGDHP
jgi:hypothetical protein